MFVLITGYHSPPLPCTSSASGTPSPTFLDGGSAVAESMRILHSNVSSDGSIASGSAYHEDTDYQRLESAPNPAHFMEQPDFYTNIQEQKFQPQLVRMNSGEWPIRTDLSFPMYFLKFDPYYTFSITTRHTVSNAELF